jgi:hypothetical protein
VLSLVWDAQFLRLHEENQSKFTKKALMNPLEEQKDDKMTHIFVLNKKEEQQRRRRRRRRRRREKRA